MSSYNSSDALNLSRLGISKDYFYVVWLLTTIVITIVAYYAGSEEKGLERAAGAVVFMVGIATFPHIRGYVQQRSHRRTIRRYKFRHGRRIASDLAIQLAWYIFRLFIVLSVMSGLNWYMFDYVGIEALPAWQFALLSLAYLYLGGSLVRGYLSGSGRIFAWNRMWILLHSRR